MTKTMTLGLAVAGFVLASVQLQAAAFADAVISYEPGTDFAPGFTDPDAALGSPTLTLSYGPVDPFNPPFATNDVVSIGEGGSLTLSFNAPVADRASNPFGVDLIIHGNEGFYDVDWPSGITDGRVFSQVFGTPGVSRVLASQDGVDYYELKPPASIGAAVDLLFPTDGAGIIGLPVNPALTFADFNGQDLAGIRRLYAGSAGGVGFDLAWAVDDAMQPVNLASANFIRIEVTSGKVEIDSVVAVPEPSTLVLGLIALGFFGLGAARPHQS